MKVFSLTNPDTDWDLIKLQKHTKYIINFSLLGRLREEYEVLKTYKRTI